MFFDLLEMTTSYIQYLYLLIRIAPSDFPTFFYAPFDFVRYFVLDVFLGKHAGEVAVVDFDKSNYTLPGGVRLPYWLPLDMRLQCMAILILGPLLISILGMLIVSSKLSFLMFLCILVTLFTAVAGGSLLHGFYHSLAYDVIPHSTRVLLLSIGLPLFCFVLVVLCWAAWRARRAQYRRRHQFLQRVVDEERRGRELYAKLERLIDRENLSVEALAMHRAREQRRQHEIARCRPVDVILQGIVVLGIFFVALILCDVLHIARLHPFQRTLLSHVLGYCMGGACVIAAVWLALGLFRAGRRLQYTISDFLGAIFLMLVIFALSFLYTAMVTFFVYSVYCHDVRCGPEARLRPSGSVFPRTMAAPGQDSECIALKAEDFFSNLSSSSQQMCSTGWQETLVRRVQAEPRLVYDETVPCEMMGGYFRAGTSLIFATYIVFLPALQIFLVQYIMRVLQRDFPLEQRVKDAMSERECYYCRIEHSTNPAIAYLRVYKPEFRYYNMSYLLEKIVLAVVSSVLRQGAGKERAWVGFMLFAIVCATAAVGAIYFRPFIRPSESLYYPVLQICVATVSVYGLFGHFFGPQHKAMYGIGIVIATAICFVPVATLILATVRTLRWERGMALKVQQRLDAHFSARLLEESIAHHDGPVHRTSISGVMNLRSAETGLSSSTSGLAGKRESIHSISRSSLSSLSSSLSSSTFSSYAAGRGESFVLKAQWVLRRAGRRLVSWAKQVLSVLLVVHDLFPTHSFHHSHSHRHHQRESSNPALNCNNNSKDGTPSEKEVKRRESNASVSHRHQQRRVSTPTPPPTEPRYVAPSTPSPQTVLGVNKKRNSKEVREIREEDAVKEEAVTDKKAANEEHVARRASTPEQRFLSSQRRTSQQPLQRRRSSTSDTYRHDDERSAKMKERGRRQSGNVVPEATSCDLIELIISDSDDNNNNSTQEEQPTITKASQAAVTRRCSLLPRRAWGSLSCSGTNVASDVVVVIAQASPSHTHAAISCALQQATPHVEHTNERRSLPQALAHTAEEERPPTRRRQSAMEATRTKRLGVKSSCVGLDQIEPNAEYCTQAFVFVPRAYFAHQSYYYYALFSRLSGGYWPYSRRQRGRRPALKLGTGSPTTAVAVPSAGPEVHRRQSVTHLQPHTSASPLANSVAMRRRESVPQQKCHTKAENENEGKTHANPLEGPTVDTTPSPAATKEDTNMVDEEGSKGDNASISYEQEIPSMFVFPGKQRHSTSTTDTDTTITSSSLNEVSRGEALWYTHAASFCTQARRGLRHAWHTARHALRVVAHWLYRHIIRRILGRSVHSPDALPWSAEATVLTFAEVYTRRQQIIYKKEDKCRSSIASCVEGTAQVTRRREGSMCETPCDKPPHAQPTLYRPLWRTGTTATMQRSSRRKGHQSPWVLYKSCLNKEHKGAQKSYGSVPCCPSRNGRSGASNVTNAASANAQSASSNATASNMSIPIAELRAMLQQHNDFNSEDERRATPGQLHKGSNAMLSDGKAQSAASTRRASLDTPRRLTLPHKTEKECETDFAEELLARAKEQLAQMTQWWEKRNYIVPVSTAPMTRERNAQAAQRGRPSVTLSTAQDEEKKEVERPPQQADKQPPPPKPTTTRRRSNAPALLLRQASIATPSDTHGNTENNAVSALASFYPTRLAEAVAQRAPLRRPTVEAALSSNTTTTNSNSKSKSDEGVRVSPARVSRATRSPATTTTTTTTTFAVRVPPNLDVRQLSIVADDTEDTTSAAAEGQNSTTKGKSSDQSDHSQRTSSATALPHRNSGGSEDKHATRRKGHHTTTASVASQHLREHALAELMQELTLRRQHVTFEDNVRSTTTISEAGRTSSLTGSMIAAHFHDNDGGGGGDEEKPLDSMTHGSRSTHSFRSSHTHHHYHSYSGNGSRIGNALSSTTGRLRDKVRDLCFTNPLQGHHHHNTSSSNNHEEQQGSSATSMPSNSASASHSSASVCFSSVSSSSSWYAMDELASQQAAHLSSIVSIMSSSAVESKRMRKGRPSQGKSLTRRQSSISDTSHTTSMQDAQPASQLIFAEDDGCTSSDGEDGVSSTYESDKEGILVRRRRRSSSTLGGQLTRDKAAPPREAHENMHTPNVDDNNSPNMRVERGSETMERLRYHHLLQDCLTESYWENKARLLAVQQSVDTKIRHFVRATLQLFLVVLGCLACTALALAMSGLNKHIDGVHFMNGHRQHSPTGEHELAGYASWEAFTANCCCVAATKISPVAVPYFALDVEDWLCANGNTKERIRRDRLADDDDTSAKGEGGELADVVYDGYAVRPLCGMAFTSGCTLQVSAKDNKVSVTCDNPAITQEQLRRW